MRASLLTLVLFFAAATLALPLRAQRPVGISTLHVFVDVPGEPGTKVTLRYLAGPDSLRGKSQEFAVPADFFTTRPTRDATRGANQRARSCTAAR